MKYNDNNKPLVCMMTQSTCYKGTSAMKPVGVLWHSTGANQTGLWRYVQPDDNASNKDELIAILGKNNNRNDWNHQYVQAGLNAWIGKLANGEVATVQTMPWNYKPWGCGAGAKGSCNSGWIQFEICEDSLTNADYFNKVYTEACELTAYLCKMYGIDPNGYTMLNGVKVPNILCHADSHKLGLGSNHGDVNHWFPKYGKSMETVRKDVAALMGTQNSTVTSPTSNKNDSPTANTITHTATSNEVKVGDVIKLQAGAKYVGGGAIPAWVINSTLYARQIRANGDIVFSTLKTGAVTGVVSASYLVGAQAPAQSTPTQSTPTQTTQKVNLPFLVKVKISPLNIRKGPSTSYAVASQIKDKGTYTIVDVNDTNTWGKLKSGAGWICITSDYVTKL